MGNIDNTGNTGNTGVKFTECMMFRKQKKSRVFLLRWCSFKNMQRSSLQNMQRRNLQNMQRRSLQNMQERNLKNMQCCSLQGSYTVEAAILFPMILFLLMAFLYTACFFHDLMVVKAFLYENAVNDSCRDTSVEAQEEGKTGSVKNYFNKQLEQIEEEQLRVSDSLKVKVENSKNEWEVICTLSLSMPVKPVKEWLEGYLKKKETLQLNYVARDYSETIRKQKWLADVIN